MEGEEGTKGRVGRKSSSKKDDKEMYMHSCIQFLLASPFKHIAVITASMLWLSHLLEFHHFSSCPSSSKITVAMWSLSRRPAVLKPEQKSQSGPQNRENISPLSVSAFQRTEAVCCSHSV